MATRKPLFLHEELMLLTLRDKKGTVVAESTYKYALGGAMLAEMLLRGKVSVAEGKRKLLELVDAKPMGDPLLDECLSKIASAKRRASIKTWVSRFAQLKKLRDRCATQLVRSGILRADEDKILLLFTRKIYPELDPRPEREIVERLRKAIFTESRDLDPRTVVLVSLAHNAKILKHSFDGKELRRRKKRIEQVINGDLVGKATKEAIEAMQAAVFVACIMPAIS